MPRTRRSAALAIALLLCGCAEPPPEQAPQRLADTGLYADFASRTLADGVLSYAPQYPLWTDGAAKQRYLALPRGGSIDARDVDHFEFPVGTRLWKQFAFGRPVETRFMQRLASGSWLYATYRWNADGSDAVLAPAEGVPHVCDSSDGQGHDLPAIADCRACHEGTRTAVLGFTALQLSPDRDPMAPHAAAADTADLDLPALAARSLLRNLPPQWLASPPRIRARTARERAVVGYLYGNCSSCHNADGPLQRLGLRFDYPLASRHAPAIATTVGADSQFRIAGAEHRIVAGAPAHSVLLRRLAATDAVTQMPPFGRHLADGAAIALVEAWIREDLAATAVLATHPSTNAKER